MLTILRWLFHVAAALSLVLCAASVALWARSYKLSDSLRYANDRSAGAIWMQQGAVSIGYTSSGMYPHHRGRFHYTRPADYPHSPTTQAYRGTLLSRLGFRYDALFDRCEAARPHQDWAKLRALPYTDLSALQEWIQEPFEDEPSEVRLKGLWFGLFNPCPDGRTPVADIYVCGSKRFDPDPLDNSWAVGPDWWPEGRYANSTVLADLYGIAYRQGANKKEREAALGNDAEYPLCLGYGAFAIRALLEEVEPRLILGKSKSLGIAVGFDSGDFLLLGQLSASGLKLPKSRRSAAE